MLECWGHPSKHAEAATRLHAPGNASFWKVRPHTDSAPTPSICCAHNPRLFCQICPNSLFKTCLRITELLKNHWAQALTPISSVPNFALLSTANTMQVGFPYCGRSSLGVLWRSWERTPLGPRAETSVQGDSQPWMHNWFTFAVLMDTHAQALPQNN